MEVNRPKISDDDDDDDRHMTTTSLACGPVWETDSVEDGWRRGRVSDYAGRDYVEEE